MTNLIVGSCKKRNIKRWKQSTLSIVILAAVLLLVMGIASTAEAKTKAKAKAKAQPKPTYTVTTKTKTLDSKMTKFSTYNSNTKTYYMLRSYLEKLEKTGGGKLILKKGTYTVTNALYVPSNVTIQLEDGVTILKGTDTGTEKMMPSNSILQFVRPSKAQKEHVYGKFEGEKNIQLIGKGTATIDLNYDLKTLGIVMGHNQNITVDNIQFKNMNGGHFIELDASNHVVIKNSSFTSSLHMDGHDKEGINLDTPDLSTQGFTHNWSKYDKQANNDVVITNNVFDGLDRAIGTHKYSEGSLHKNVVIRNNTIQNMRSDAIRVMNWSNPIIENNTITNIGDKSNLYDTTRGILLSGVSNPTIQKNTFIAVPRAMQFMVWKNTETGSEYKPIYNTLSEENKKTLQNNIITSETENYIRINNKEYGDYTYPEKIYLPVNTTELQQ
ncbi:right-handed parallel beta-helix repeat-containing protein [Rummeliibacillus pycnus]|uniref:right-handed parallel beta-helix repeat-containing protein n=1 Tax=Rummeliibacillus pycnus TaxID=101070 RepID=UPI0037C93715